ncbi:hypothetical protein [Geomonas propionica]|uniref:Pilus assembly protein FimV n=1 Tax=Geomonas propionica TaxID=2798582 RepID=A0ABS0YUI5_9BACT|nr:hypothetical protein [Geomonas propionica]MBJ6801576.1 hypothetical protein [Geomonas propionica]
MTRFMILVLIALFLPAAAFAGGLEVFISNVNVQARADMPGFSLGLSTQFGVPVAQVQTVVRSVAQPADAFMILQLGQMSHRPPESVLAVYQPNRNKGWGAIAKELGIKPGSREFHALKSGDLYFTGTSAGRGGERGDGPGNGHRGGHGKGHKNS